MNGWESVETWLLLIIATALIWIAAGIWRQK